MRRNDSGLARYGAGLIVALAFACAPTTARADCGDYVHTTKAEAAAAMPDHQPNPHAPCDGPNCSRRDAAPPAPAAPKLAPTDLVAALVAHAGLAANGPAGWLVGRDPTPTPPPARSIFHPPR